MASPLPALVLAPLGRDGKVASSILAAHEIDARVCASLAEVLSLLDFAGCLVVAEEALVNADRSRLAAWFEAQPTWSDFPVVLLTMRGTEFDRRLSFLDRSIIVLERPFLASSLANSVRSAIRARTRQLEVKSYIDEKEAVSARQQLLIRELHHRVKNTLANVKAMMSATARSKTSVEEFLRDFSARVVSLADTHSMLTDDYWQTAPMRKILEGELRHYDDRVSPRVVLEGPEVLLVADVAIPVGMAFHELASNSSKFGALSTQTGKLQISWRLDVFDHRKMVELEWRERGGPTVMKPTLRGFGTTLLERVLAVQCDAKINLDYQPEGLVFTMALPLPDTRLVPSYS